MEPKLSGSGAHPSAVPPPRGTPPPILLLSPRGVVISQPLHLPGRRSSSSLLKGSLMAHRGEGRGAGLASEGWLGGGQKTTWGLQGGGGLAGALLRVGTWGRDAGIQGPERGGRREVGGGLGRMEGRRGALPQAG